MNNQNIKLIKKLREKTGAGILQCKKVLEKNNYNINSSIDNIRKINKIDFLNKKKKNKEGIILGGVDKHSKFGILIEINCETDFVSKNSIFLENTKKILQYSILKKIENINILKKKCLKKIEEIRFKTKEQIEINKIKTLKGEKIIFYLHNKKIGALVSIINKKKNKLEKYIAMQIVANKPEYLNIKKIPKKTLQHEFQIQLEIAKKTTKKIEEIKKITSEKMKNFKKKISLMEQNFIMNPDKTVLELTKKEKIKIIQFKWMELGV